MHPTRLAIRQLKAQEAIAERLARIEARLGLNEVDAASPESAPAAEPAAAPRPHQPRSK